MAARKHVRSSILILLCWAVTQIGTLKLAHAESTIPIEEYLQSLRHGTDVPQPKVGESCSAFDVDSAGILGFENDEWSYSEICSDFTRQNLCLKAVENCKNRMAARTAGRIQSCFLYSRRNKAELEIRSKSNSLKQKIFQKAAQFFEQIRGDSSVHSRCCGDNSECVSKFQNLKFKVLAGLPPLDKTAYYLPLSHTIYLSEGSLIKCMNESCVEQLLLHEMGHACQFSRYVGVVPQIKIQAGDHFCSYIQASQDDFKAVLGAEISDCITRVLQLASKTRKESHCLGSWMTEIFATMALYQHRSELSHWEHSCVSRVDYVHGPIFPGLECMMKSPQVRQQYCGGKP